jgi:hypothetical protein
MAEGRPQPRPAATFVDAAVLQAVKDLRSALRAHRTAARAFANLMRHPARSETQLDRARREVDRTTKSLALAREMLDSILVEDDE